MSTFNKYRLKGAYHKTWYETEDWYKWMVDEAVAFCQGSTIDLGGGDGVVAKKIAENGHQVLVVDNDEHASRLCWGDGIPFLLLDVDSPDKLARPEVRYDYLACINSIEHFNKPENVLKLIRDNISKGAIVTTIDWQGGAFGEDHKKEYTLDELVDFFKEFNPEPFRYMDTEWIGVKIKL